MNTVRRLVVLVAIALLGSGASSAPAFRHCHAMGEHSHSAGELGGHSHEHRHAHTHHHHHHEAEHRHDSETPSAFREPPVEHLHVVWLGIELTWPVSSKESSSHPTSCGEWVPLYGEMLLPQVVTAMELLSLDELCVASPVLMVVTTTLAEPFVPPRISRLCDIARRERSGVLNI